MFSSNNIQYHSRWKQSGVISSLVVALATMLAILFTSVFAFGSQDLERLNNLLQASTTSNASADAFRKGRELIGDQNWAKAAEKFESFINDYPEDKNVDAALYWLAFALKKQGRFRQSNGTLERLIDEYPKSNWAKDAKAMQVEMATSLGNRSLVDQGLNENDDEIKTVALQSLFQTNPERGVVVVSELLRPTSKASRRVKENAISLLGQYGGKQGTPVLLDVARNNTDEDVRKAAILHLARSSDETVFNFLKEIALTSRDAEVAQAAVYAISQQAGQRSIELLSEMARNAPLAEVRSSAIHRLAQRGAQGTGSLVQLYDAEKNSEVKLTLLHWIAQQARKPQASGANPALDKLVSVARSDPSTELRQNAIHWVAQRGPDSTNLLIQLYDTEKNTEVKLNLLHGIAQRARKTGPDSADSATALRKLEEVAKSDPSVEMRQSAVHWIAQRAGDQGIDTLISLYDSQTNNEMKQSIIHFIAQRAKKSPAEPAGSKAAAKLMAIARNEASTEIRQTAIHWISERRNEESIDSLIQLFDSEKNREVKETILHRLGQAAAKEVPNQPWRKRALRKLMEVAKSDASVDVRRSAVHWLGQSKDPEALKFIEEILK